MASPRQLPFSAALLLTTLLTVGAAVYGMWSGFGGLALGVTLCAFFLLLGYVLLCGARGVTQRLARDLSSTAAVLLVPLVPVLIYLAYALSTLQFTWVRLAMVLGYVYVPALLLGMVRGRPRGAWQDYTALLLLWLPLEAGLMQGLWPYPGRAAAALLALFAMTVGILLFLLLRRLEGVAYTFAWAPGWATTVLVTLAAIALAVIPLGIAIDFMRFEPSLTRLKTAALTVLAIFLFSAWPQEFLFRGILQNLCSRSLRSPVVAWIVASAIFALAHVNEGSFPNWSFVLLSFFAGLGYGHAWRKTGSMFPAAVVHTAVNLFWFLLFSRP